MIQLLIETYLISNSRSSSHIKQNIPIVLDHWIETTIEVTLYIRWNWHEIGIHRRNHNIHNVNFRRQQFENNI